MKPAERVAGIAFFSMLLALATALPASAAAAQSAESPAPSPAATADVAPISPTSPGRFIDPKTELYRQREAQSPQTANFRGGDGAGIYIGGTAGVVIVVLLVILLLR